METKCHVDGAPQGAAAKGGHPEEVNNGWNRGEHLAGDGAGLPGTGLRAIHAGLPGCRARMRAGSGQSQVSDTQSNTASASPSAAPKLPGTGQLQAAEADSLPVLKAGSEVKVSPPRLPLEVRREGPSYLYQLPGLQASLGHGHISPASASSSPALVSHKDSPTGFKATSLSSSQSLT